MDADSATAVLVQLLRLALTGTALRRAEGEPAGD